MDFKKLSRAASNAHILKKQKSIEYTHNYKMKTLNKSSKADRMTGYISKSHNSSIFSTLKPIESVKAICEHKEKLSKMYKSRLLPSQFLSTPASVIEKLTENLYNSEKPNKKRKEILPGKLLSTQIQKLGSKPEFYIRKKKNTLDSHAFLDNSCKEMLEDNLESRKILRMATVILEKNSVLNEELKNNVKKLLETNNLNCFEKRLKDAHEHLVKNNKINAKRRKSSLHNFFLPFSPRKSIG